MAMKNNKTTILIMMFIALAIAGCLRQPATTASIEVEKELEVISIDTVVQQTIPAAPQRFAVEELSAAVISKITNSSWKPEAPVGLEELRLVRVMYWGFDEKSHTGELIIHQKLATDVVEIFTELYEAKFNIDKITLIDEYSTDDSLSMADNNTSAFNYRTVQGSGKLSKHSYGFAIDINPIQNPYVTAEGVFPSEGKEYLDRENIRLGMIVKDDVCYNAFVKRGWTWGGSWKTVKDYQHFQKNVE